MMWLFEDRRQRRSPERQVALRYQLESTKSRAGLEALVVADDDGLLVAHAGDASVCAELGAYAPLVRRALGMKLPPLLRGGDVAVRPFTLNGQRLFLASIGGGVARDALLKDGASGIHRILASN